MQIFFHIPVSTATLTKESTLFFNFKTSLHIRYFSLPTVCQSVFMDNLSEMALHQHQEFLFHKICFDNHTLFSPLSQQGHPYLF